MRADSYRLFRGKAIYLAFALCLAGIALSVFLGGTSAVGGVSVEAKPEPGSGPFILPTMVEALTAVLLQFKTFLFLALIPLYVVCATDFNSNVLHNSLANGLSRTRLYFARLILSFLFIEALYIVGILVGAVAGAIAGGTEGLTRDFLASFLGAFAAQSLMLFVVASVGTAIAFITRKGIALGAIYLLIFVAGGSLVLLGLGSMLETNLMVYDFLSNAVLVVNLQEVSSEQMVNIFGVAAVYLALSLALGPASFKKAEIK
jgi:hypothetical protein